MDGSYDQVESKSQKVRERYRWSAADNLVPEVVKDEVWEVWAGLSEYPEW